MPDGTKGFGKSIMNEPEKYFTKEVMQQIEKAVEKEFLYGEVDQDVPEDIQ